MIDILAESVGGFDALLGPGMDPAACAGSDCNAVGVCLQVAFSGTTIRGVGP